VIKPFDYDYHIYMPLTYLLAVYYTKFFYAILRFLCSSYLLIMTQSADRRAQGQGMGGGGTLFTYIN
ncbi:MAG: hypothetical protein JYX80_14620, partial [Candidatus Scalindua sediminis]|nr:hypothetical protein [Candidatus Scalindua sediminis]